MQDVFAVQDELARTVASSLEGRVAANAVDKVKRKPTQDWQAYDYFLQGREWDSKYDLEKAEACYARATELDPTYAHAYAFRAIALAVLHWGRSDKELLDRAEASANKALSIDAHDAWSQQAAGFLAVYQRKFDLAGVHFNRALNLNPNDVLIAHDHANWLTRTGNPQEALQRLNEAMQRDPYPPEWMWEARFRALFHLKRYDEAIAALSNVFAPHDWFHAYFAAAYAYADRLSVARASISDFLRMRPAASISFVARVEPYSAQRLLEHLLDGLRKAGLPE